jgi:hypothetical protein
MSRSHKSQPTLNKQRKATPYSRHRYLMADALAQLGYTG